MKHSFILLFFFHLLTTTEIVRAQDPNFHIYLAFGQSNMEGQGTIQSEDKTGVSPRFQVIGALTCTGTRPFTMGSWATATPPLVRCYTGLGIADYFGRTMVAELPDQIKLGIVPVAVGGCDIGLFDKVNYAAYAAAAPTWMQDIISQYGGNPYARLVEVAKLAQKNGVIKGIIFHQGETNTNDTGWKNKVAAVVENLKTDLGLSDIPFLAGELLAAEGACCSSHNVEVNKLPDVIPNAHVISSADLAGVDNAHFTAASYRIFGERYARKMLDLIDIGVTAVDSEDQENAISIYPTPAVNGFFTVQNIEKITHMELFTLIGQRLGAYENSDRSSSIDIQVDAGAGLLLLKLSDGQKEFYKKVLVR